MESKGIVTEGEPYLQITEHFAKMPKIVHIKGILPPKRQLSVAIVGTRRPTPYGKEVTYQLAYELAKRGVIIISGLAFGIDAVAHRAALDAGGKTIAILAHGLDTIYPASHRGLAQEIIAKGGALISEYPDGISPRKHQFLARNRLVSGLADAVVVTEAAAQSGTLSTVTHALDQNKEVFAVPGNITSLLSIGPNHLIQQGAHPVLSVKDILNILDPAATFEQTTLPIGETPLEQSLLSLIQSGVRGTQSLHQESGASMAEVLTALSMLEIKGSIHSDKGTGWTPVTDR